MKRNLKSSQRKENSDYYKLMTIRQVILNDGCQKIVGYIFKAMRKNNLQLRIIFLEKNGPSIMREKNE